MRPNKVTPPEGNSPANAKTNMDRREVLWNLVLQYSTVALMLIQGVVLIPVYLRFLGSAEFGVWLVTSGVATWLSIVDPGLSTLIQQRISFALRWKRSPISPPIWSVR